MLSFAEIFLPGARFLRPVLFSGVLWLLAAWLVFHNEIPDAASADGFSRQVYDVVQYLGPFGFAAILLVSAFIVGTVAAPVAATPARAVRGLRDWFAGRRAWSRHVKAKKLRLIADIEVYKKQLEAVRDESQRTTVQARLNETTDRLKLIWPWSWLIETKALSSKIGKGSISHDSGPEEAFLQRLQAEGAVEYLESVGLADKYDSLRNVLTTSVQFLAADLRRELRPDPLDLVHALDKDLYLELDRERAEREVRIAVSPPVIAIASYAAVAWSPWALVVAGLALVLFLENTVAAAVEPNRVIRQLDIRGLEPSSAKAARRQGRDDAYVFAAQRLT